jgi:hypothetical protein
LVTALLLTETQVFRVVFYRSVIPIALASDKMPVITIILFTLKFDEAGKLKIVKTQQLSEEESQKYQHSNRRRTPKDYAVWGNSSGDGAVRPSVAIAKRRVVVLQRILGTRL